MKVLVLGASGATGSLVVRQLINKNINVKVVVRIGSNKLNDLSNNRCLETVIGNISLFDLDQNIGLIKDCDSVVCCLGHNISFKGIFGKPRMLVTDSIRNICNAIKKSNKEKTKLILMNTTANMNRKAKENYSRKDRIVLSLLALFLPPHKDNVAAARYLSNLIGENNSKIEWIAIRPDTLINEEKETEYEIVKAPKRSPVFDSGKTSRINVAHFIAELLIDEELWSNWKFQMPVIYNK